MWIILLDHSGSMGNSFGSVAPEGERRARRAEHEIKLDAAKEIVVTELKRHPGITAALMGFTGHASLIHHGQGRDWPAFEARLRGVKATNGTDIAAALDAAVEFAGPPGTRSPGITSVLLVTDGLSDRHQALAAAERCVRAQMMVNVILIDPTPDGVELATDITQLASGHWDPVYGSGDLAAAAGRRADEIQEQSARAEAALARMSAEAAEVAATVGDRERLQFTAAHSGLLRRGPHPLLVYTFTPSLRAEVDERIRHLSDALGPHRVSSSVVSQNAIAQGQRLDVRPSISGLRCVPESVSLLWQGRVEEARFEIEYVGDDDWARTTCDGRIDVLANGLIIAQIAVSVTVDLDDTPPPPVPSVSTATMIEKIFASYAREDTPVVQRCKAAYQALGVQLLVDRDDLRSGEPWDPVIQMMIGKADLFQLYWSSASAVSTAVESEWQLALRVAQTRPPDIHFIRPLYWQESMPDPPPALSSMQFQYVDLESLGLGSAANSAADVGSGSGGLDVTFPVLSCAEDPSHATGREIRGALREIVPFLERLTGLRYYPPVTVLVEKYVVAGLRRSREVDWDDRQERQAPTIDQETEVILDLLGSLLLTFHSSYHLEAQESVLMRERRQVEAEHLVFERVRHAAEAFVPVIRDFFEGREVTRDFVFPAEDTIAYVDRFLALVVESAGEDIARYGDRRFNGRYAVSGDVVAWLRTAHPDLVIPHEIDSLYEGGSPEFTLEMSRSGYLQLLADSRDRILGRMRMVRSRSEVPVFVGTGAPTYGVFKHGHETREQNGSALPWSLLPLASPAVLVCADAFTRVERGLRSQGHSDGAARRRTAGLLRAMLVHEHCHGVLATGVDAHGRGPLGAAQPEVWRAGHLLNESLATWAQLHYARGDTELFAECTAYINAGDYPDWPYRGAEIVEAEYLSYGERGIRRFISLLREDPCRAQERFDDLAVRFSDGRPHRVRLWERLRRR